MARGTEMFIEDARADESPDLALWAELLEPEEIPELYRLSAERRKKAEPEQ